MKIWFFNCEQVSKKVSEGMDSKLPPAQRVALRFHMLMCTHCARYERQLHRLRRLSGTLAEEEESLPAHTLDDRVKERLRRILTQKK